MKTKQPTATYRELLREAFDLTWHRKSLWVFGLLAGLLSTGGVLEIVLRTFRRVETGSNIFVQIMEGSFAGFDWFGQQLRLLQTLPSEQVTFFLTFITVVAVAIFCAAIIAQAALITGVDEKSEPTMAQAMRNSRGHFASLLGLNVLVKLSYVVLILLTTLPLLLIKIDPATGDTLFHGLVILVFFPAMMIITVISQLALIAVVRENAHAFDAIHTALRLVRHHWLAAIEYSIVLFFLVMFAGIAVLSFLILLSIPFGLLLGISIAIGTPFFFAIINITGAVVFFTVVLAFCGASVAFQYASWMVFYHRALHRGRHHLRAKLHRLILRHT